MKISGLIVCFIVLSKLFAGNCDNNGPYEANFYSKQIKLFKSIPNDEKVTFFKSVVDSFSNSNYTHNNDTCFFFKQSYQIKLIRELFKKINNLQDIQLLVEGKLAYVDFLLSHSDKLLHGPFSGDNQTQRLASEIRCNSKSSDILGEAVSMLTSIDGCKNIDLCNDVISIEIKRCSLQIKSCKMILQNKNEAIKNYGHFGNYPESNSELIENSGEIEKHYITESNACLREIIIQYQTTPCFNDVYRKRIMDMEINKAK